MAQKLSHSVSMLVMIGIKLIISLDSQLVRCSNVELSSQLDKSPIEKYISDKADDILGIQDHDASFPDDAACHLPSEDVVEKISELAVIVTEATISGERAAEFQEYLAKELNIDELVQQSHPDEPPAKAKGKYIIRSIFDRFESRGLSAALYPPAKGSWKHRDFQLSNQGRKELLKFSAQKFRHRFVREQIINRSRFVDQDKEATIAPELERKELPNWLKNAGGMTKSAFDILLSGVLKNGVFLLDQLYASPHFLEYLPILGQAIICLKEKGKPMHNIIKAIRAARPAVEMDYELTKLDNENLHVTAKGSAQKDFPVMLVNKSGQLAIQLLAAKLLQRGDLMDATVASLKEIAGRFVYYIMSQIAPKTAKCMLEV